MNAQPLPMAPSVDVDPALYPPQQRRKEDERKTGSGLGTGIGIGSGEGAGPGRGVNVGGGESGAGNGPGINVGSGGVDYNRTFTPREVDRKARMLTRPEPQYTQLARENQISGTVVLRAIFTASGAVTNIRAISGLPYGLTERAIAAARQIKFEPAMKDGRAVSQYIQIEYNFYPY
jgi:protein TonB